MEIRIIVFLALVSVSVVVNAVIFLLAYNAFAGVTSRVTQSMNEFSRSSETRELISSLQVVAERAAAITESTKVGMAKFDPVLARAHASYRSTLLAMDSKMEGVAGTIDTTTQTMRDVVAKPAFAAASFVAGIARVLRNDGTE